MYQPTIRLHSKQLEVYANIQIRETTKNQLFEENQRILSTGQRRKYIENARQLASLTVEIFHLKKQLHN